MAEKQQHVFLLFSWPLLFPAWKKALQVWNYMRLNKQWHTFHFQVIMLFLCVIMQDPPDICTLQHTVILQRLSTNSTTGCVWSIRVKSCWTAQLNRSAKHAFHQGYIWASLCVVLLDLEPLLCSECPQMGGFAVSHRKHWGGQEKKEHCGKVTGLFCWPSQASPGAIGTQPYANAGAAA